MKQWEFATLAIDTEYQAQTRGICSSAGCLDWLPEGGNSEVHVSKIKWRRAVPAEKLEIVWCVWDSWRLTCSSLRSRSQKRVWSRGLPWRTSDLDSALSMQGVWVRSLVREIRSCLPYAAWPKKNQKTGGLRAWSVPLLLAKEVNFYHKQRGVMETIFPSLGVSVENFVVFLNFYWSWFKCCVGFRSTTKRTSYTYVYSFLDCFPI